MRFSLLFLCVFSAVASNVVQAEWHEPFQAGDRVFDSRNYQTGTVVKVLSEGSIEIKLDKKSKSRIYSSYYAAELGPKINVCNDQSFCTGDKFIYSFPIVGKNRVGEIVEVFQGSDGRTDNNKYGKIVYGVKLEDESEIRYLNSDHLGYMELLK